jgi:hypothetical protein
MTTPQDTGKMVSEFAKFSHAETLHALHSTFMGQSAVEKSCSDKIALLVTKKQNTPTNNKVHGGCLDPNPGITENSLKFMP